MVNPVLKAIKERRSTLRFKPIQVDEEKIYQILEAGRWAPSWTNSQPWSFIIVTDSELKQQLSQAGLTLFSKGIQEASHVIIVVVDPTKDPFHHIEDGSIATQNIALASHSLGLATYWIGIFNLEGEKESAEGAVKEILKIPKDLRVISILPIGVPAYEEQSERKNLTDIIYKNYYGE